tara:strand:- start:2345 stop:2746 length:402 start_codon:yes stop_codon:yes gene_type:complete
MKKNTKIFFGVLIIVLVAVAGSSYVLLTPLAEIDSFEDCINAGFPAMESYPRQCNTADGKHFVEDITIDIPAEELCEVDEDCACGVHIDTRDCFLGNKDYVDISEQCPDYCTGIAGNRVLKCMYNRCASTVEN